MQHISTFPLLSSLVLGAALSACGSAADPPSPTTSLSSAHAVMGPCGGARCGAILPRLPAAPSVSASTVPRNGDINPYGVSFVPDDFPAGGLLRPGDVIVSNFNNSQNLQGTGTTVVRVNANASPSMFFQDGAAQGLSTALGVLRRGFVLVGNAPSLDGSGTCSGDESNVGQGAILVIDRHGRLVRSIASPTRLAGPWDLTVDDEGAFARVFVSDVLTGTVTRIDLAVDSADRDGRDRVTVLSETQIASGYAHRCDPAAFVVGPTGVALDPEAEVLYVASAGDNAIFAIDNATERRGDAGMGRTAVTDAVHLHGPLGLARSVNGDLISAQGDAVNPDPNQPSEIVEFSRGGRFVAEFSIDSAQGSAFGLALRQGEGRGFRFAAVDDGMNVLDVWNVE